MSFGEDLTIWLKGLPGVAALVGDRVHQAGNLRPGKNGGGPGGRPYVTHFRTGGTPEIGFQGAADLGRETRQVDIWAESRRSADAVADEIERALHGYRGPMGVSHVQRAEMTSRSDADEPPGGDREKGVYHTALDFEFAVTRDLPVY